MKTTNFFEELKKYFQNTPREQVLADWKESEALDKVGPSVEEFLKNTHEYCYKVHSESPQDIGVYFNNHNLNPEFTSGFFNYKI